jgi:hypothetical protein
MTFADGDARHLAWPRWRSRPRRGRDASLPLVCHAGTNCGGRCVDLGIDGKELRRVR